MLKCSPQVTLSLIVTFGFFFCIFYMLKWGFPAENKDALNSLMGVLTTIFTLQQNFFFGSSSGSAAKDAVLGSMAQSSPVSINTTEKVSGSINIASSPKDDIVTEQPKKDSL